MKRTWLVLVASVVGLSVSLAGIARAEWYVAGQAGYSMPNKLESVEGQDIGGIQKEKVSDLELEKSLMYGAKVGYFFENLKWLGVEAEAFTTTPNIKQQRITRTSTVGGLTFDTSGQLEAQKLRVTTAALNVIFRLPGRRFEPYVGAGVGMYWAKVSSDNRNLAGTRIGEASDTSIGMNFLAGARYYMFKRLALFGEYKYTAANFDFGGNVQLRGDYSAHNFVGGLSVHFK